jgi:glycosyltransferase involved in cell wall biosynthesis
MSLTRVILVDVGSLDLGPCVKPLSGAGALMWDIGRWATVCGVDITILQHGRDYRGVVEGVSIESRPFATMADLGLEAHRLAATSNTSVLHFNNVDCALPHEERTYGTTATVHTNALLRSSRSGFPLRLKLAIDQLVVVNPDYVRAWGADSAIRCIPPGVDPTIFVPRVQPPLISSRCTLFLPGRPVRAKGLVFAADLASVLSTRLSRSIELIITGEPSPAIQNILTRSAQRHGWRLISLPWMPRDHRLARAYHQADVVLAPSEDEGFGMVLLEAMASAVPIVASDLPAAREVIRDHVHGRLCSPGALRDWVAAIESIASHPAPGESIRAAATALVHERWDLRYTTDAYLRLWTQVAADRSRNRGGVAV